MKITYQGNIILGTKDSRGAPVIFIDAGMDEWQMPDFNSEEIARVCLYFYQIPRYVIDTINFLLTGVFKFKNLEMGSAEEKIMEFDPEVYCIC